MTRASNGTYSLREDTNRLGEGIVEAVNSSDLQKIIATFELHGYKLKMARCHFGCELVDYAAASSDLAMLQYLFDKGFSFSSWGQNVIAKRGSHDFRYFEWAWKCFPDNRERWRQEKREMWLHLSTIVEEKEEDFSSINPPVYRASL